MRMRRGTVVTMLMPLCIFLVSCATPLATFNEKVARVNYLCSEIEANKKLTIYDVRRACWGEALREFPEYSAQIQAMLSKIDDIEAKAKQGQDVTQDVKKYETMYTNLYVFAQRQAENEQAKQQLFMQFMMMGSNNPAPIPSQNNNINMPRQQQLNCHTSNSGGVPQTVCY